MKERSGRLYEGCSPSWRGAMGGTPTWVSPELGPYVESLITKASFS